MGGNNSYITGCGGGALPPSKPPSITTTVSISSLSALVPGQAGQHAPFSPPWSFCCSRTSESSSSKLLCFFCCCALSLAPDMRKGGESPLWSEPARLSMKGKAPLFPPVSCCRPAWQGPEGVRAGGGGKDWLPWSPPSCGPSRGHTASVLSFTPRK